MENKELKEYLKEINFPYENIREGQDKFILNIKESLENKKNIMVSAPTGLGKTISALAPAIDYAIKNDLTVICLTSRQTQINQIIKTINDIEEKSKIKIDYVAFLGKKNMCVHDKRDEYPSASFNDFCKKMTKDGKCPFYKNTINKNNEEIVQDYIRTLKNKKYDIEEFIQFVSKPFYSNGKYFTGFCPYQIAIKMMFKARVIICDYNYIFIKSMYENFIQRIGRNLDETILVIDEAHNLPSRITNSYSFSLSTDLLNFALKELKDFVKEEDYDKYIINLRLLLNQLYVSKLKNKTEDYVTKKEFVESYFRLLDINEELNETKNVNNFLREITNSLDDISELIKEEKITSYIERVSNFLKAWMSLDEEDFTRIIEKEERNKKVNIYLRIKCLDPSKISSEIINGTSSTILMSATLEPLNMFKDILGVNNTELLSLDSPFPKENLLVLVDDRVSTKFSLRTKEMIDKIAKKLENIIKITKNKNGLIFFPSYELLSNTITRINFNKLDAKVFVEKKDMNKNEKEDYISKFKTDFSSKSKVLFGVISGSFSEGLDLPETALEYVIIVGLPLSFPDLYTKALINHYNVKFNKGQLYAYIYPAITKIVQAGGRCIRTEKDVGFILLMDFRYTFPIYKNIFPKYWNIKKSTNIETDIKIHFLNRKNFNE